MEESNNALIERKDRIIRWVKNPYNLGFIAVIIFAIIIRLYYFSFLGEQPVWWDEGEYMSMARAWAFDLEYDFLAVRPILLSLINSIFLRIYPGEFLPRVLILILSIASIIGMYLLGKEIYNKKVGLIAASLMSASYLNIFYSFRLLVDLPSLTFFIFSALFFYKYFKYNSPKMLYYGAIVIAIGTMFRITTATFLIAMAIYVLITQKLNFVKKKEIWIAAIIFILILSPYLIWGYLQFNGFVITLAGAHNAPQGTFSEKISNGTSNIISYIKLFPLIFSWPVLIFFILGILLMYNLIIGFDLIILGKGNKINRDLFLLLIFIIPILTVSFSLADNYHEDRYVINSLPAVFIITGSVVLLFYKKIKPIGKFLAVLFIILFLGFSMYPQLNYADDIIKAKKDSYKVFKESGIWLKENTQINEKIITSSWPMTGYYSQRGGRGFFSTEENFEEYKKENPSLKYFIISTGQPSPQWTYTYPQRKNLTVLNAYFADIDQQQPILIIYKLENTL